MNALTLRQLRYFDALARLGHFGRAAEACAVTQPALSMQIRELEAALGASLVERGTRRLQLTDLGRDVAERAGEILRATDELHDLARAARLPFSGRFRLGAIPTVAPYLLPQAIAALSARYPGLDLHPREAVTGRLVDELLEGRLDAAILALPVSEPALHEEAFLTEEFVLIRPEADRDRPVPDAARLGAMRLLLLEEGHCFRDQALSFCKAGGDSAPRDLMEGSSLSTLVQMVGAGIGVTLIPEMALEIETRSAPVAPARLAPPRPSRRIGLVWRRRSPLAQHLQGMAALLRVTGEKLRARPLAMPLHSS